MINKFFIQGFKDQVRSIALAGLDLFTSNNINGVGKSALLEGFKLALLGEIPGRARTVEDLIRFSSADEMAVGFAWDRGGEAMSVERHFFEPVCVGESDPF
ncbi:hypothetical protein UR09_03050 [Candidatus Nitromaritima sp. SCGC AAA799-A02]|nr:hypothetical protein UR09_03050 [Candidatus Nitromaritima sp. SCGC AAA799-A02]